VDLFFVDAINEVRRRGLAAGDRLRTGAGNKIAVESISRRSLVRRVPSVWRGSDRVTSQVTRWTGACQSAAWKSDESQLERATSRSPPTRSPPSSAPSVHPATPAPVDPDRSEHGQRFVLITPFAIVPEPASLLFALLGGVWVLGRVRPRRSV
jgi:hypothetical protein